MPIAKWMPFCSGRHLSGRKEQYVATMKPATTRRKDTVANVLISRTAEENLSFVVLEDFLVSSSLLILYWSMNLSHETKGNKLRLWFHFAGRLLVCVTVKQTSFKNYLSLISLLSLISFHTLHLDLLYKTIL